MALCSQMSQMKDYSKKDYLLYHSQTEPTLSKLSNCCVTVYLSQPLTYGEGESVKLTLCLLEHENKFLPVVITDACTCYHFFLLHISGWNNWITVCKKEDCFCL